MSRLADVGLFYIAQQVLGLRAILLIPLVSQALGVAAYGSLVLAWHGTVFLQLLTTLGFPLGVVRLLSSQRDRAEAARTLPTLGLFVIVPWAALLILLLQVAEPLGVHFELPMPRELLVVVAVKALFDAWYFIFTSYWIASGRRQRYVALQVGLYAGDLLVVVGALLAGLGVLGVLLASALWEGVVVSALVVGMLREMGGARLDRSVLPTYLAFCVPGLVPQLMQWTLNLSDRFFLAAFRGGEAVGTYNAAYNLASLILSYSTAVWFVFAPTVSRGYDLVGAEEARRELRMALRAFLGLAIPMAVGLSVLGELFLAVLLRGQGEPGGAVVVPIVCVGIIASALYTATSWSFALRLDNRPLAVFSVGAGIANLLLNLVLVPALGMLGAAVAAALSYGLLALLGFAVGRRYIIFPVPWGFIARSGAAAAIMGGLLYVVDWPATVLGIIVAVIFGAALYLLLLLLLGGLSAQERQSLRGRLVAASRPRRPTA